ncbi:glutamate receptor-like [Daphnia pulicaria]|uniref:glutamate receptor-like n=1 Tax=Daphnia pulicaria TaxID=35523 RepID=UPI001EE9E60E|nr:glutamate receptor-like [Daphnia pulicaria]
MHIEHDHKGQIYKLDGFVYQMVLWLSVRFNFTFTVVEPKDGAVGALVNNTWNGMIHMAIIREVDLVAAPVVPSSDRIRVVDFSISYLDEQAACLIPAPTFDRNKWTAVFRPFDYTVWLMIIFSLVSIATITWMTTNAYWKWCLDRSHIHATLRFQLPFSQNFLFAFGALCSQSKWIPSSSYSTRIATSSWCLMSAVYAFSSCIIAYLTIPKSHLLVNSIEELANSEILQVATLKNSIFETTLLQSNFGPMKNLGDSLRKNPENRLTRHYYNQAKLLDKVFGRLALTTGKLQLDMLMELDYRKSRRCDLTLLPQQFMPILKTCLALPKGSTYTHLINLGIIEMNELGLVDQWIKRYVNQTNQCSHGMRKFHRSETQTKHPLTLSVLASAFALLLLGIIVSYFTFFLELYFFKKSKNSLVII